jgi:preprotein translocase SecE subunit
MVKNKRPVAQLAEQRSPKPQVAGSSPSWPATSVSKVWQFLRAIRMELLKVSWPSFKDVMQTTVVVAVVILLVSLFLWSIDSVIIYAIKWLAGQKR